MTAPEVIVDAGIQQRIKYHHEDNPLPCRCGCVSKRKIKKIGRYFFVCNDCMEKRIRSNNKKYGKMAEKKYRKTNKFKESRKISRARKEGGAGYADRILR